MLILQIVNLEVNHADPYFYVPSTSKKLEASSPMSVSTVVLTFIPSASHNDQLPKDMIVDVTFRMSLFDL